MPAKRITIPPALNSLSNGELARIFECSVPAIIFARRRDNQECVKCGRPALPGSQFCTTHKIAVRKYQRTRQRQRKGFQQWKPGRRGRPLLDTNRG